MGPIRAFSRPSHALIAGEFVTSASPFSPTPGYSPARRSYYAYSSSALASHHTAVPHPHLYGSVCATDPLRAGLVSSSPAALPTYLLHFKKPLPPGAASPDTHLDVPVQQDTRSDSQREGRDAAGSRKRKETFELGRKDGSEYERKSKERKIKNKSEKKLKKREQGSKSKHHNGEHKRHEKKSDRKWEKFDDFDALKINKDQIKWKNKKYSLAWNKHQKEDQCTQSEEEYDEGREGRSINKPIAASVSCPATKADEPCTSRMSLVFPISDDDDDGFGHDGGGEKENNEESWPISDIVETEDEEGESKLEHNEGEDCEGDGPSPQRVNTFEDDAEAAGVFQQHQLASTAGDNNSAITKNGNLEDEEEDFGSVLPNTEEWQDLPPTEKHDLHKDYDADEEHHLDEQTEQENEDKRRLTEEDWPRDGVRATQRLRPRTYR